MKSIIFLGCFLSVSFWLGCTTTSQVCSDVAGMYYTYEKFNTMAQSEVFEVAMKSGIVLDAKNLYAQPDSTRWHEVASNGEQSVATVDISYVAKTNHFAGAIEGFFMGATAGAVATLPFTLPGEGDMHGLGVALGVFYGGIGGGALGVLIGSGNGHTSKYQFIVK